jgi:hypothetical protein
VVAVAMVPAVLLSAIGACDIGCAGFDSGLGRVRG